MILRYRDTYNGMECHEEGDYVEYEDHLAEMAKKDEEISVLKSRMPLRFRPGNTKYKPLEPTYIDGRGTHGLYSAPPLEGNEE